MSAPMVNGNMVTLRRRRGGIVDVSEPLFSLSGHSGRPLQADQVLKVSVSAPLVTICEIGQPPPSKKRQTSTRYKLQDVVSDILPRHRIGSCMKKTYAGHIEVWRGPGEGSAFYTGLMTCGSVWVCPVCSSKISERRRSELSEALEMAKQKGYQLYFLTLTIPHYTNDSLKDLLSKFSRARVLFKNRKSWKTYCRSTGIKHSVRALEVTLGKNGWHVHSHEILFIRPQDTDAELCDSTDYDVLGMWQRACKKVGLPEPNEHGVDIQSGNYAAEYASKWGMVEELALSNKKKGRGSMSPWDIIHDYALSGDEDLANRFREYANSFKGKRQLVWSEGLREELGLGHEKTDEEVANEKEEGASRICTISQNDWKLVVRFHKRGELLDIAREGGIEAVHELLNELSERGP